MPACWPAGPCAWDSTFGSSAIGITSRNRRPQAVYLDVVGLPLTKSLCERFSLLHFARNPRECPRGAVGMAPAAH